MSGPPRRPFAFLAGGGELGERIEAFDWSRTPLGAIERWPPHLTGATALMLRCEVPIVMLWGESGVMIYNDAYSVFAGARHPLLLGSNVREGWPEVADFNDHVMRVGLAGGTLRYRDQELTLYRSGRAEQVWMNLDYSPLLDADGAPAGVMAVVVETTSKVLAERALGRQTERLAQMFEQAPSFIAILDGPSHRFELANPSYRQLVGGRQVVGRTIAEALPEAAAQGFVALLHDVYRTGVPHRASGARYDPTPGMPSSAKFVDFVFQPIRDERQAVTGIFVEGNEVTSRVIAERRREFRAQLAEALRDHDDIDEIGYLAAELLGETLEASRVGYGTVDLRAGMLDIPRPWHARGLDGPSGAVELGVFGSRIEALARNETVSVADVRLDPRTADVAAAFEARHARSFVNVPVVDEGRLVAVLFVNDARPRQWSTDELAFVREVAERTHDAIELARSAIALRQSEARLREANETLEAKVEARTRELLEVEAKLRQSQKMEALGQLTGGIAHDFNNMLSTISVSLQVLRKRLPPEHAAVMERYITLAQESVRRAATLTQRLLAFSRRQTLDPRPVDVNRLIGGIEELIRRSVGPSVAVEVVGAGGLWPCKIDVSQLENALLNLCLNGRDAMAPSGGQLTIETANKWLDERAAAERELPPGQYISICVTDTGTGMTPDVVAHAFDPFFTTKPVGQGTGLGLSMVYGFVRQSGGQVRIYTEVGAGTTMCLYLPRHVGDPSAGVAAAPVPIGALARGESILLVEDEESIRLLLQEELAEVGYRVLAVGDGAAALRILQSDERIDLLITDVGLPGGLNGRQVADAGRSTRPELKVLFITGYAENAAVRNGLLEPGMEVVTKPFDVAALVAKVRQLIER